MFICYFLLYSEESTPGWQGLSLGLDLNDFEILSLSEPCLMFICYFVFSSEESTSGWQCLSLVLDQPDIQILRLSGWCLVIIGRFSHLLWRIYAGMTRSDFRLDLNDVKILVLSQQDSMFNYYFLVYFDADKVWVWALISQISRFSDYLMILEQFSSLFWSIYAGMTSSEFGLGSEWSGDSKFIWPMLNVYFVFSGLFWRVYVGMTRSEFWALISRISRF